MCGCKNKQCASCSNADGDKQYDPIEIGNIINAQILDGKGSVDEIKDAYVKVRMWLDEKKLEPTQDNISSNKDELKIVINDPNYLSDKEDQTPGYKLFAIIAVIILIGWWAFR